jgi:hypothetical protein
MVLRPSRAAMPMWRGSMEYTGLASYAPGPGVMLLVAPGTCGDHAVSSCRSYRRAKVLALVQERFLWRFPWRGDLGRVQGVLDGEQRGPVGPPGPLELAALWLKRVAYL